ncbi:MAG: LamG-like jellyroll fold domain-containing protein, partial [Chloroflexota bacterium]|nr:LamG-like jellyroll fold domain-containing protein [Chloroflexota bacterium]
LYINGSSDGTGSYSGSLFDNSEPIEFGQGNGTSNSERLDGYLDEIAFWNKALTSAEASALYNSGAGLSAASNSGNYASLSNLKGYWKFSENSGSTAYDLSGLGHHGTISGAAYNTSTFTADETAPTISSVSLDADNLTIAVTMSEAVYTNNNGAGALETGDFGLSINGGSVSLGSSAPSSISANGNVFTLGLSLSGIASGNEQLSVHPRTDNSIYDAAGNAMVYSTNNKTVNLNNLGESLSFDGTNDYVLAQVSSSSLGTQASISAWIYSDVFDGEATVIDLYNSADANNQRDILTIKYHESALKAMMRTADGWYAAAASGTYNANQWHHVVIVRNGTSLKIYMNGSLAGSNSSVSSGNH